MDIIPKTIKRAIEELSKMPGIGPKSAARVVFYLLSKPDDSASRLGESLFNLKKNLKTCHICFNYAEEDPCIICQSGDRDKSLLCVVEEPLDVIALEKAGFKGLYHVLGGAISPINGIGPDDLRIAELISRVRENSDTIKEVIIATNPSLEGEATASYIADRLQDEPVKITRLAHGLPMGGDLEYADELTLSRSLEGRREM